MTQQLFGGTTAALSTALVIIFLTYFLLASGDLFLHKLVAVLPQLKDKKTAVRIVRETQTQVSLYLVVTTMINTGVGIATGIALALVGMPNPVLWGVVAGVLNFVPYIGGLVNTIILTLAAFLTFEDTSRALLVPIVFTAINILEGNLITPMIMGRRMRLEHRGGVHRSDFLVVSLGYSGRHPGRADDGDNKNRLRSYCDAGSDRRVPGAGHPGIRAE